MFEKLEKLDSNGKWIIFQYLNTIVHVCAFLVLEELGFLNKFTLFFLCVSFLNLFIHGCRIWHLNPETQARKERSLFQDPQENLKDNSKERTQSCQSEH